MHFEEHINHFFLIYLWRHKIEGDLFHLCLPSQVGESGLQSGNLYSPFMKTCRNLFLGGNHSDHGHTFRGSIGGLLLWDYERSHGDLLKRPLQTDQSKPLLAMWADFTRVIIKYI